MEKEKLKMGVRHGSIRFSRGACLIELMDKENRLAEFDDLLEKATGETGNGD